MSVASKLFDIFALTGSTNLNPFGVTKNTQPEQEQQFRQAGELANPDIWNAYNQAMKQPASMESAYALWDEMAGWDLMAAALNEVVEETVQRDSDSPGSLWYSCNDAKVEEDINNMLRDVRMEDIISSQAWHEVAFGNNFEKIDYEKGQGVKGLSFVHPVAMRRYWLQRNRQCVGYRWMGHTPGSEGYGDKSRAKITISNNSTEDLWYPWDFMHTRRMHRNRTTEHGEPLFVDASSVYKKIRIALDQMVVYRAQIQPDRYVVNIDTKDMPPSESMKTVQRWKQSLRSRMSYGNDKSGLGIAEEFKSFYNAWALDSVLWIAKPREFAHSIEKLAGTTAVPDIYDVELLMGVFFSVLGMPRSWIGVNGGDTEKPTSGKALLAQDMRFLRKIKSVRAPLINSYEWLAYFHCALKDQDVSSLKIQAHMSPIGSLEDNLKMEVLKTQVEILNSLGDVMDKYQLPRELWIELVFKRYMKLPADVVNIMLTSLPPEANNQSESIKPRESYSKKKVMEDIVNRLGPGQEHYADALNDVMSGNLPKIRRSPYRSVNEVLNYQAINTGDIVSSGWDGEDLLEGAKLSQGHQSASEKLFESDQYRKVMSQHIVR
jgi:hypothetical protein